MEYHGTGKLELDGEAKRVIVRLDPDMGYIVVKFPIDNGTFIKVFPNYELFDPEYSIKDLKIELPNGSISHDDLKGLYLKSISPGTRSVYDSALVRSFNLLEKEIGITTMVFFPKSSVLNFDCDGISNNKESELIYNDAKVFIKRPALDLKLKSRKYSLSCDNKIAIVKANLDLLARQDMFYRVLSLLQGGKITYRSGVYRRRVQINFTENHKVNHLGLIFNKDADKKEFIEKYWEYEDKLNKQDKNRHKLFVEYFLEGMSALSNLENRLISLYTAIEIIDGSKTLNKNSIASIFSISLNVADIIVRFRNKIIHQGYTGNQALAKSIEDVKKYTSLGRIPFKTSGKSKTRSLFNFYIFLVMRLYEKLFADIAVNPESFQLGRLVK